MNYLDNPQIVKQIEKHGETVQEIAEATPQEGKTFDEWFLEVRDEVRAVYKKRYEEGLARSREKYTLPTPRGFFEKDGQLYEEVLRGGKLIVYELDGNCDQETVFNR